MSIKDYVASPKKMKSVLDSNVNKGLKETDLTASQVPFILEMAEKEGLSMKDLCVTLGLDKGLATRAIRTLIKNGYVVNKNESSKTSQLYLTDKGKEAYNLSIAVLEQTLGQILECLDEQELRCLEEIINKLNKRLDELYKY
jgi:DNA-binding MarR family transcriptional regulator